MASDPEHITEDESRLLAQESSAARTLDSALADGLGRSRPGGATSSRGYLRGLSGGPVLDRASETELVHAARHGDPRARDQLVEACLPLIAGLARMYRTTPSITRMELMQEGAVGVLRALERFDPEVGAPFRAYASWWARQAMQQLVAELTRPTVLSDHSLRRLSRIRGAHREFMQVHRRPPSTTELAARTGLPEVQVTDLLAVDSVPRSLDEPVAGADETVTTLGELLDDPLAADAYERLLDESEIEQVRALMGSLTDRERTILRGRYGLDGPEQSLRDIGDRLGLSAERVRQIEQRALGKLRAGTTAGCRAD